MSQNKEFFSLYFFLHVFAIATKISVWHMPFYLENLEEMLMYQPTLYSITNHFL